MDDLIARVAAAAGLKPDVVRRAVAHILAFLQKEGPADDVAAAFAKMPGAAELAGEADPLAHGGGLLGVVGGLMHGKGGLIGLAGKLTGLGLDMGEMHSVGHEVFTYAGEHGCEEEVGRIAASIPGLSQFI